MGVRGIIAAGVVSACGVALAMPRFAAVPFCDAPDEPVFITTAPGDSMRLYVVEQSGVIRVVNRLTGAVAATPFLDLSADVYRFREMGMLGLAFHPDYATNRRFYVYFSSETARFGLNATIVAEFTTSANPAVANNASGRVILRIPNSLSNHNAGWIAFGPDRHLYIASGERGTEANAQILTNNLLGKILRVDVNGPDNTVGTADDDQFPNDPDKNYCIPAGNPFVGCAGDDEIILWGLRNPWRCAIDPPTNTLWIGDVGAGTPGEIDVANLATDLGRNLSWPCLEGLDEGFGPCQAPPVGCASRTPLSPIIGNTQFGCALTGGVVYRGCGIPALRGYYLYSDYCGGYVHAVRVTPNGVIDVDLGLGNIGSIVSFGTDQDGEVYLCDLGGQRVSKLVQVGGGCDAGCDGYCPGDLDDGSMSGIKDCAVGIHDLIYFLVAFEAGDTRADLDDGSGDGIFDGAVSIDDLVYFLGAFERGC